MAKFARRVSKGTTAPDKAKKTSETLKIPANKPKAPMKPRRAAKKMTKFPEPEVENRDSIDSGFEESQRQVNHRYPTRARIAAQATQNNDRNQTKSSSAKPAKPKRYKHPPDVDKENDGSAANGPQPRQGKSSNKRRLSGLPVGRPVSQNLAKPDELNSTKESLSQCSSDNWIEHIRWLQPRRDVGLWIECTRKGCGKWRYADNYHDPLDVPKLWFCEMNTDARFADCSIPQEETPEAENPWYIENKYNAGSIVWAKVNGFPWWPAMVDDCPDLFRYFEIRGSSIVPYKYHVKFFNEMKIAWMPVRNLKPYAENPRSTFLKKTVFRRKDYSKELDAACKVANEALPLTLLQRLERFSWVAQISGGLREEDEGLAPDAGPTKKTKSTIEPRIIPEAADNAMASPVSRSTRKRPVDKKTKKNVTRNTKTRNVTVSVRSRLINVETDSSTNTRASTSELTGASVRYGSQSQHCSSHGYKASFLEPNELFKGNSSDRSKVDNFNIDDAPVPNPASKSTQSIHEKQKCTEEAYNQRCTKRITRADLAALAQEIRNTRPFYAEKARNSRAATQIATASDPSVALHSRGLSLPVRSDETLSRSLVNLRSSVDAPADIGPTVSGREDRGKFSLNDIFAPSTSRTKAFVETSIEEPIELDLTGSSTDFEGCNDRRESLDFSNHAETRDNSQPPNPTFASTSNGSAAGFGSIKSYGSFESLAVSSQPEWAEMADRCPSSCGLRALSVDLEVSVCIQSTVPAREDRERFFANDIIAASTPQPEVRHSRSTSRESSGASSFRMNSASFGEGSGRTGGGSEINFSTGRSEINFSAGGSEINFSAGGSEINFPVGRSGTNFSAGGSETNSSAGKDESISSSRKPILIDLTNSSTDIEGYYDRREYPDYPNHVETRTDSQSFDPRFASTSNRFGPLDTARQFRAFESFKCFGSIALPSQPEWDKMSEQRTNNSGLCVPLVDLEVGDPSVSATLPEQDYSSPPNRTASWSSDEPASSKHVLDMNEFSLLDILTRLSSSGSSRSSGTIVPSSQPEMDQAFEQRPRFPGLFNNLRDSSTSTYSLPKDIDFGSPGHASSEGLFEVITMKD